MPLGIQEPRFRLAPSTSVGNAAAEAIQLAAEVGQPMDPWQSIALEVMLGEEANGSWSAQEMGVIVARQNGKNAILETRELAGLWLFDEPRIVHSAHQAATAAEAFNRMLVLLESTPWLERDIRKVNRDAGKQFIQLKTGQTLSYRTRTKGGARGFSAPVVVFDEAQELTGAQIAAILPVVSSFRHRQVIYTGTVLAGAVVFRGVVARGRGEVPSARLGYTEWSADEQAESDDVQAQLQANPSTGIRIELEYIEAERLTFLAAGEEQRWREERLSIWPRSDAFGSLVPIDAWAGSEDAAAAPGLVLPTPHALGIAVSPDRRVATVGFACANADGRTYLEVVAQSGLDDVPAGIDWVVPWVTARLPIYPDAEWLIDAGGPAASLGVALIRAGANVRTLTTGEWKTACAGLVDDVTAGRIRHSGQPVLTTAAHGVKRHDVGEQWVYARRDSGVLVAPLEAVTLARAGIQAAAGAGFFVMDLNDYLEEESP